MLPLSYQNIGFTAILCIVAFLVIVELAKYLRQRFHKHN